MPYKPRDVYARLLRAGFLPHRQQGTSHAILKHTDGRKVVVPMHPRDLKFGTFKNILKQAGLTLEEFRNL
jgi:predicted RNA binding protein YcfA (HicA-like mRNA interferase family)